MTPRNHAFIAVLLLGLVTGPAAVAQDSGIFRSEVDVVSAGMLDFSQLTIRDVRDNRTTERSALTAPSVNGGMIPISDVVDEAVRLNAEISTRTRREFAPDADGRLRLVATLEERLVEQSDGTRRIARTFSEDDVDGRSRVTRRETEHTVAEGDGVFRTTIERSDSFLNGGRFAPAVRVEQRERRRGELVAELERTTYANRLGRSSWDITERRMLRRRLDGDAVTSVETVYRPDVSGHLMLNDRTMTRTWTTEGTDRRTDEVFTTNVPNQVQSMQPRLFQLVETRRTNRPDGGWTTTRTVSETRNQQLRVVKQVIENTTLEGRTGRVTERTVRQLDVNGRLEAVETRTVRETGTGAQLP